MHVRTKSLFNRTDLLTFTKKGRQQKNVLSPLSLFNGLLFLYLQFPYHSELSDAAGLLLAIY